MLFLRAFTHGVIKLLGQLLATSHHYRKFRRHFKLFWHDQVYCSTPSRSFPSSLTLSNSGQVDVPPSASCVPICAIRPLVPIPTTKEPFKERGVAWSWRNHWRKATKSCNSTRYGISLYNRTNCSKTM
jgi:hypothetical protein